MERWFVKSFVNKQKQERLLFELQKKRKEAIDRFAHSANEILERRKMVFFGKKIQERDIEKQIEGVKQNKNKVYIISGNNKYDKKEIFYIDALRIFKEEYMPMIIICYNEYAIIKGETEGISADVFIMKNNK